MNRATTPADSATKHDIAAEQSPLPLLTRVLNLLAILIPLAGLLLAMVYVWGWGFDWLYLGLLIGMYILTGFGVTIGFHRLFTHRSFRTSRIVESVFAILGSMSVEGPMLKWVATHRCHHQHSDHDADPHSPHTFGGGLLNILRGLWRAHVGWIFERETENLDRYIVDFREDRLIRTISAMFPLWAALGFIVPGMIAFAITQTWTGALLGVLWGGLVRLFFVHHVTWSVNSVCHVWGTQPFRSHDESRNNAIVGVLAFGEGWHNNHHAFPTSARHGLKWWQIDTSYMVIKAMKWFGLARDVRIPDAQRINAKRR